MKKIALRLASLVIAMTTLLSLMTSCKKDKEETPNLNLYDLTGFTIIRDSAAGNEIASSAAKLKQALEETVGISLTVGADVDIAAGEKEILIGETNRQESKMTIDYLKNTNEDNSYAIRIAENKIVITGTDELSTRRAVAEFIRLYVDPSPKGTGIDVSAGCEQIGIYDSENIIILSNGTIIHVDYVTDVLDFEKRYNAADGSAFAPTWGSYPSITELKYQSNPENNGKLIATMSISAMEFEIDGPTSACVMMSEDKGLTWKALARPQETLRPELGSVGSMAHIYELPAQVGDMPAGTLLYSYNAVNYDHPDGIDGSSILALWRSYDCGVTWEEYVIIDEAKGIKEGIWEPFMIYSEEDQYLYCFYSDDSDPDHDQKVVYKRSKDGVNWEGEGGKIGTGTGKDVEPVDVVAINDFKYRPGMPVITKMGNGEYFIVYEQFGDWKGCPIFYKTTKDLSDWGDPNDPGTLIKTPDGTQLSSGPACIWADVGGECGTLIVTAKAGGNKGYMLVSTDYGKTWEKIDNPISGTPIKGEGDRVCYSPAFWLSTDGKTIYYINSTNARKNPTTAQTVAFARIALYESLND